MRRLFFGALLLVSLALPGLATAQETTALGDGPLELDAAGGVEWRQEERLFIAEGGAVARQAGATLRAQRLVAAYRDAAKGGGIEIFRVDAEGDVRIENEGDVATGARAVFDLADARIRLTGPGLRYASGRAAVTAGESLEYDLDDRRAIARGNARVDAPRGQLAAPVIEARIGADGDVQEARASGGVVIRTGAETLSAREARYDFALEQAEASGDVRLVRGSNVLTGARATIDFKTGVARLDGGAGGRVRGLVFPKAPDQ